MGIKVGNIDILDEIINNKVNIDVLLNVLARKGLLTQAEFDIFKKESSEKFRKDHPELYKKPKKKSEKKSNEKNK